MLENIDQMEMKTQAYWPQHKVFFLATLALFPEKLVGMTVEPIFWWPYFEPISRAVGYDYGEDDFDHFRAMLFYYQRDGYLTYEQTPHDLFKIKSVNSQKAKDDLTSYLKKWQDGRLTTNSATKPPDVSYQQELFIEALRLTKDKHQSEPRITSSDIYGDLSKLDYDPPFWELLLSQQILDKVLEITFMDYGRGLNGIYSEEALPFAELNITDKKLLNDIDRLEPKSSAASSGLHITPHSYDPMTSILFFGGKDITIVKQKSRVGNRQKETAQGRAMRMLFKDVNTLKSGVQLSRLASVRNDLFNKSKRKTVTNHLDEINRKILSETNVQKLINYDQVKYYIDKSYLK